MLHWVEPRHLDIVLDLQKPEVQDLVSEGRQGTSTSKSFILGRSGTEREGGGQRERERGRGTEGERVGERGGRGREEERKGEETRERRKEAGNELLLMTLPLVAVCHDNVQIT